ncbi:MAG: hypothetical protein MUP22_12260, partial [Desulfobacterales bacterium]|nr:hypothetical protein [Desulfobacterales bacterium]
MMTSVNNVIGIDIGSVSISAAVLNLKKNILSTAYVFHHGKIPEHLEMVLKDLHITGVPSLA